MGNSNIKICTVHSFKGWEADTIIYFIFNLGDIEYDIFFKKYIETELIL